MSHISTDSDIAATSDLDALGDRLDLRIDRLETRMDGFDTRMDRFDTRMDRLEDHMVQFDDKLDGFHQALRDQTRTYMYTMSGVTASFAAVVVSTGILT